MHWRHVSITTTPPCWGSRLVALRAHVLLAERIGAHPLSQCAHPGQLGGVACRGLPSDCMLGDGARGVPRLTPNTTGASFCDVICIWSITKMCKCNITYFTLNLSQMLTKFCGILWIPANDNRNFKSLSRETYEPEQLMLEQMSDYHITWWLNESKLLMNYKNPAMRELEENGTCQFNCKIYRPIWF